MDSTQLQLWNDILTGAYVVLTLLIAGATIWSLFLTRASLNLTRQQVAINKKQSEDALIASEKQSQATMQAVHEQIQASERQNREQIENQYKPFILPITQPISNNGTTYTIPMINHGAGVALNVWGLFTMRNFPLVHYCKGAYLLPPKKETACGFEHKDIVYQQGAFAGYPLFLQGSESGIKEIMVVPKVKTILGQN